METLIELKKNLITACRILDSKGIMDEHRHFSARCPEQGGVLIKGT